MGLLWVVGLAAAGGLAAQYLRLPGGVMFGSMVAVAAYTLLHDGAPPVLLPEPLVTGAQMVLGAMLGIGFTLGALRQIQAMLVPSLVTLLLLLAISYGLGLLLARLAGIDVATGLFSMAPGGMNYIAASAQATGANGGVVAVIHLIRIILTIVLVPLTIQWLPLKQQ
jgi:membrane AbrB-like protein